MGNHARGIENGIALQRCGDNGTLAEKCFSAGSEGKERQRENNQVRGHWAVSITAETSLFSRGPTSKVSQSDQSQEQHCRV
jgi:hypothetical protein